MKKLKISKPIESAYQTIRDVLEQARAQSYRAVNIAMVQAYWNIGRIIVEEEQKGKAKAGYGENLLKELSARLTREFGKGFDASNLRYMRLFYLSFEIMNAVSSQSSSKKICDAVRHELPIVRPELSWTHYRLLLKVERSDVRKFYLDECIAENSFTTTFSNALFS